jgi:hypothetical protein
MTEKQWPLTVWRSFRAGDKLIPRGTIVSDADLASWANGRALVAAGILRRMPPAPPVVRHAAPAPAAPQPAPPDPVTLCRAKLAEIIASGVDHGRAVDKLISTAEGSALYQRAQKVFADRDTRTFRKSTDGFDAYLMKPPASPRQEASR